MVVEEPVPLNSGIFTQPLTSANVWLLRCVFFWGGGVNVKSGPQVQNKFGRGSPSSQRLNDLVCWGTSKIASSSLVHSWNLDYCTKFITVPWRSSMKWMEQHEFVDFVVQSVWNVFGNHHILNKMRCLEYLSLELLFYAVIWLQPEYNGLWRWNGGSLCKTWVKVKELQSC